MKGEILYTGILNRKVDITTRRLLRKTSAGFFMFILIIMFTFFLVRPGWARTIQVPDDSTTIQAGIDGAAEGDTVLVADGVYTGEGNKNLDFLGKAIVVRSENGPEVTVIDCEEDGRGFHFHSGEGPYSTLEGFTISHGSVTFGAGILCEDSSPNLLRCVLYQNHAAYGGGISLHNSAAVISQCVISQNSIFAEGMCDISGAGIIGTSSNLTITNCMVVKNEAYHWPFWQGISSGGGVVCDLATVIDNCIIIGNVADYAGGIIATSSTNIINSIVCDNRQYGSQIAGNPMVHYSNIQGGWPGEGNIDQDPLFRDPDNGDYHLMATYCGDPHDSPCIDAGHPDSLDAILDCWHGLGTGRADMGAYGGGNGGWPTAVEEEEEDGDASVPMDFVLFQNYPNPFNSETVLRFYLSESGFVNMTIYNVLGQKLQVMVEGHREAGEHSITWDASELPSGIYFARLEAGGRSETVKMVLLR